MNDKTTNIQRTLIENIKKRDNGCYKVLLKAFFDSEDALGKFLLLLVDVDKNLSNAILATLMANGNKILELEQTLSTYETALKAVGKEVE